MRDRFLRAVLLVLLALVLVVLARPYIDQALFAAKTPRAIEARGDLAEIERLNIEIFQRASPSVVQIASRPPVGLSIETTVPAPLSTTTAPVTAASCSAASRRLACTAAPVQPRSGCARAAGRCSSS